MEISAQTEPIPRFPSRRLDWKLALLFVCVGALRIISTYHFFNQTFDEAVHIASGVEWWEKGTYTVERQHPPLSRLAVGLGPYLMGVRMRGPARGNKWEEGNLELATNHAYWSNLTRARMGILSFYLLACLVVWLWAERAFGSRVALFATALFTCLPAILGHGALATTDMAVTATLGTALFSFILWLEDPSILKTAVFGVAIGLAMLSKFSTLLFLPAAIATFLAVSGFVLRRIPSWRALQSRLSSAVVSLIIASALIWAGYRFALTPLIEDPNAQQDHQLLGQLLGHHPALLAAAETISRVPLPGMMMVRGIGSVWDHNKKGHSSSLLGEWNRTGWWYFFPVLFLFKTPLAFLILVFIGVPLMPRCLKTENGALQASPAVFASAIIGASLFSHINIGLRHILPVYPLLAILAGYALETLLARPKPFGLQAVAVGLALWFLISSARAHPDYLAYFNELALDHPERITVESDLDWGQDLQRLADRLRQKDIHKFAIEYHGSADLQEFNLPPFRRLAPYEKVDGWVAISLHSLELPAVAVAGPPPPFYYSVPDGMMGSFSADGGPFSWLKSYRPIERIGQSILLYEIPPTGSDESGGVLGAKGDERNNNLPAFHRTPTNSR